MRKKHVLAALVVTAGLSTVPAVATAATPAATTWAGWDAPGPLGVGSPSHVAASGGTTAVLGSRIEDRSIPLVVTSAAGSRIGRVAVTSSDPSLVAIAAAGPDRLLLADGCRIGHSEDRGLTWSYAEALAGCVGVPQFRAVNSEVAFAWTTTRTWRTTDGGATWPVVNATERGPELAVDANVGFRIVTAGPAAVALQRTGDGGASWQGVKVPAPPVADAPAPAPADPPVPADAPTPPATVDSLPGMAGLARRADGAILVGAGDALLVSTDNGATFTRALVPVPDDLPGSGGVVVENVVCDPGGTCVVGVHAANDANRRSALRLVGGAFDQRVAALPSFEVAAPAPASIVGRSASAVRDSYEVLRTDDFGATPYSTVAVGDERAGSIGVHGVLALPSAGRLHVSANAGKTWTSVPLPATPNLRRVAAPGGNLVALADDGSIRRFAGGTWQRQADLTAIRPSDMAVAGGVPIVVGARGIVRLTDPAAPKPVWAPILQGRGFSDVAASGNTVLAWARSGKGYLVVRSTDGGKTWKKSKLPANADEVQVVNAKTTFVLSGRTLLRSSDGGKRFLRRSIAPNLGSAGPQGGDDSDQGLEFSSATTGAITTSVGAFVTRDGGSTLQVLPTPGAATPPVAAVSGSGVTIQDDALGAVFRNPTLLKAKAPKLTLRTAGKVSRRGGVRTVTVIGVLSGAGDDEPVAVLGVRKPGSDTTRIKTVVPNADGSFRIRVRLAKGVRGVQAWYRGAVRPASTSMSSTSKLLRVR